LTTQRQAGNSRAVLQVTGPHWHAKVSGAATHAVCETQKQIHMDKGDIRSRSSRSSSNRDGAAAGARAAGAKEYVEQLHSRVFRLTLAEAHLSYQGRMLIAEVLPSKQARNMHQRHHTAGEHSWKIQQPSLSHYYAECTDVLQKNAQSDQHYIPLLLQYTGSVTMS